MPENQDRLRLAAILAADVAGYSRLMGHDQRATVATLTEYREIFRDHIESNGGRVVDMAGDSVLAVFENAIGAAKSAVDVQAELARRNEGLDEDRRMLFRVGVNLGDVIEKEDGSVYGDGVNVAARLEAMANPGGVNVSGSVYDSVRSKLGASFDFLGEHDVKNISDPVRAYRVLAEGEALSAAPRKARPLVLAGISAVAAVAIAIVATFALWPEPEPVVDSDQSVGALPPLPTGPSIAALPFDNIGGDPEQEYFADGLAEDILTRLAAFQDLKVIARNSSFQYRDKAVDVREIGQALGADFVLDGSVRRDATAIRVSAQLLDASDGSQVWSDTYDRDLSASSIFGIQDEISGHVARALGGVYGAIFASEVQRVQGGTTDNLRSYECVLLAKRYETILTAEAHLAARDCLEDVVVREPTYVDALSYLGLMYISEIWSGFNPRTTGPPPPEAAFEVLGRAVQLDPHHQHARTVLAWAHFVAGDKERFFDEARKAVALNPNEPTTLTLMAQYIGYAGSWDESKALSQRLKSLDFPVPIWHYYTEFNYGYRDKDYEAATTAARATLELGHWGGPWYLALAYAGMGEDDKAMDALAEARTLEPNLTTKVVQGLVDALFLDREHAALLMEGHAGLLALEESRKP